MNLPKLSKKAMKDAIKKYKPIKHTGYQAWVDGCGTILRPPNNRRVWVCPDGCPACKRDKELGLK